MEFLSKILLFAGYLLVYASVANKGAFVTDPWAGLFKSAYDLHGGTGPPPDASTPGAASTPLSGFGGGGPAPAGVPAQRQSAIAAALAKFHVPSGVFYGMWNNETALGSNVSTSSAGAIGDFQFEPATARSYGYPLTNTPNPSQFQAQANSAARYLSDLFHQLGSWSSALAAYNAGPGNIPAGAGYAARAIAWAKSNGLPVN